MLPKRLKLAGAPNRGTIIFVRQMSHDNGIGLRRAREVCACSVSAVRWPQPIPSPLPRTP